MRRFPEPGFLPMPPYDGKRHENPHSTRHVHKREVKPQLIHDGQDWTNTGLNEMLADFLRGMYWLGEDGRAIRHNEPHAARYGRTADAMATAFRQLVLRYDRFDYYKPERRMWRGDKEFDAGDHIVLKFTTGETGVKHQANDPDWEGGLLMRPPEQIVTYKRKLILAKTPPGFLDQEFRQKVKAEIDTSAVLAALIQPILVDMVKKFFHKLADTLDDS